MFASKCAEVFCHSYENFAIVCTDCNLKTNVFNEFVLHYRQIHCNLQPAAIKTEEAMLHKNCSLPTSNQSDPTEIASSAPLANSELSIKVESCRFEDECEMDEKAMFDSDDEAPLQDIIKTNPLESSQYTCLKCGKIYANRPSLRTHLHRSHPELKLPRLKAGVEKLCCAQCPGKSFSSFKTLQRHKREKHPSLIEATNNHQNLVEDNLEVIINHVDPTEVVCIEDAPAKTLNIKCEAYSLENEDQMVENIASSSEEDLPLQDLFKKNAQDKGDFTCPVCDKKYSHRKSFLKHLRRNHPDYKIPRLNAASATTTCADCPGKTYSSRKALQRHRREKHAAPLTDNFQCPHCEKQFKTQNRVTVHLRYVHKIAKSGVVLKRYPCTHCDRVFSEKYLLKRHEARHTGVRNFTCPVSDCGMSFYDVKALGAHKRFVHVGKRNYVCDICGFSTKTSSSLQTHIRTHTGEKPFKCDQCHKCFTTSAAVSEHKVIHNSHIRPHVCDVCGKTFARPKALYHHKPLHLGIKKFICKICGKAYAQQAGLSAHKRQHAIENFGEPL